MAFLALVFAMGGFAVAANQSATTAAKKTKVKACFSKKTGELRVAVKGKRKCRRGEKKLVWNKRGVRGKRGAAGPAGATGQRGATGLTGPQGPAGLSGGSGGVTLGPGSVGTQHLADGSITAAKLLPGVLTDNLLGLVVEYEETANNSASPKSVVAYCPAGTQIVGGGGAPTNGILVPLELPTLATTYSGPPGPASGWQVNATEIGLGLPGNWTLSSYAICIRD